MTNKELETNEENNINQEDVKSTKNILNMIYLIIAICVLIWAGFYIKQNKIPKIESEINEITNDENSEITIENNVNEISISTWIVEDNTNSSTTIELNVANSWTLDSSWEIKTEEDKKNEEAIIKDFEKELDSLFDVIDQNAR